MYKSILPCFISFALFYSCETINPEEVIPGYIEIESFELVHEKEALGISDVWVWVDGNNVGVYGLPAKFPVLSNDTVEISISAGIKVNGQGATRSYYPYYKPHIQNVIFNPGEIIKISPKVSYHDWATSIWSEDFDSGGIGFTRNDTNEYYLEKNTDEFFQGNTSGAIFLQSTRNLFEEVSIEQIATPEIAGSPGLFLEMNFKSDMVFAVALYVNNKTNQSVDPVELVQLYPTDGEWKKIYIDLYNPLLNYPEGTAYKVVISNIDFYYSAIIAQPEKLNPKIYIDDLKIVQRRINDN